MGPTGGTDGFQRALGIFLFSLELRVAGRWEHSERGLVLEVPCLVPRANHQLFSRLPQSLPCPEHRPVGTYQALGGGNKPVCASVSSTAL